MKKVKSTSMKIFCMVICFTLLAGCTKPGLSEDFDKEEVKKAAEEVVKIINNNDSDALLEMSTVEMKNALTEDVLEEVYEAIDEGGEYIKIKEMNVGGSKDKNTKEEYAVAVVKTEYENKEFIYTISFTKQMKLAGLYY